MSDNDKPKTVDELLDMLSLTDSEKAARMRVINEHERQRQHVRMNAAMEQLRIERSQSEALYDLANAVLDRLIAAERFEKNSKDRP